MGCTACSRRFGALHCTEMLPSPWFTPFSVSKDSGPADCGLDATRGIVFCESEPAALLAPSPCTDSPGVSDCLLLIALKSEHYHLFAAVVVPVGILVQVLAGRDVACVPPPRTRLRRHVSLTFRRVVVRGACASDKVVC